MRNNVVLTIAGPDRIGIVEDVTRTILRLGGNVETSRMARLGGEFAILMLVTLADAALSGLDAAFEPLRSDGYTVSHAGTHAGARTHEGWKAFTVEVRGADHEGIVHEIAHGLSAQGVQIESGETTITPAAVSGTPLFSMRASVLVPPSLDEVSWRTALERAARDAGVDLQVTAEE